MPVYGGYIHSLCVTNFHIVFFFRNLKALRLNKKHNLKSGKKQKLLSKSAASSLSLSHSSNDKLKMCKLVP